MHQLLPSCSDSTSCHTRFSNDLAFSVRSVIDPDILMDELNRVCDFVQENCGVEFVKERHRVEEKTNSENERKIYRARKP